MDIQYLYDILQLVAVAVLILLNAFFVAAEFSLVSVRPTRVVELVAQGSATARWLQRSLRNPDGFIAASQLGITIASLALGWMAEPALAHLLEPVVNLFALGENAARSMSAAAAFTLVTFLTVVVGELAPKSVALQRPESTALQVARPMVWTMWLFRPIIWALNGTGNALLRVLGFKPATGQEVVHSVEELKMLVKASAEGGVVEDDEEDMLHAVFDFGDTLVRQVMVPRTEVVAVPAEADLEQTLKVALEHPFSKFPVYEGDLDHMVGVLHVRDLLRTRDGGDAGQASARSMMRDAIFVPETARVRQLLRRFRARHQHIAIVLDEYGGTAGVVALEDLLEEIVGDIQGPFDKEPEIQPQADGSVLVDGLMMIEDVNSELGLELHDPHYDTIAGYILGRLGRMARPDDQVSARGIVLRVHTMDGHRIAQVLVKPLDSSNPIQRAPGP
jgi:putative hemolysin